MLQDSDSLVLLSIMEKKEEKMTMEGMDATEVDKKQKDEEKPYKQKEKIYIGGLSSEEDSDSGSDYSGFSYFS